MQNLQMGKISQGSNTRKSVKRWHTAYKPVGIDRSKLKVIQNSEKYARKGDTSEKITRSMTFSYFGSKVFQIMYNVIKKK